jgi:hypothetical protein
MMRSWFFWFALLAIMFAAAAATAEPAKTSLTYLQAQVMQVALTTKLDSFDRVIKEGSTEKVIREPFSFAPIIRIEIAKNIATLKTDLDAFEAARQGIISQYTKGSMRFPPAACPPGSTDPTMCRLSDEETAANLEFGKLQRLVHEVALYHFKLTDLPIDRLAPSAIADLLPIIDE